MNFTPDQALRVYLVADPAFAPTDLIERCEKAIAGGVSIVQLRGKSVTDREAFALGTALRRLCTAANIPLVINDRIDLALALRADGVHLGVDDLPLEAARAVTSPSFIIGYSPETDDQVQTAAAHGANYLGIGPVFGTSSKSDAGAAIGTLELSRRIRLSRLPVVGIGGITASNAPDVIAAGASGVAMISAILAADDPRAAATRIRQSVDQTLARHD